MQRRRVILRECSRCNGFVCLWAPERMEVLLSQSGQRQEELLLRRKLLPRRPRPAWRRWQHMLYDQLIRWMNGFKKLMNVLVSHPRSSLVPGCVAPPTASCPGLPAWIWWCSGTAPAAWWSSPLRQSWRSAGELLLPLTPPSERTAPTSPCTDVTHHIRTMDYINTFLVHDDVTVRDYVTVCF